MKILKNLGWVQEVVNEYIDTNIMTKGSIIYGGLIRDIIAKKKLKNDVDMATSSKDLDNQLNSLICNCKWKKIQKSDDIIKKEINKYKFAIENNINKISDINFIHEFKNNTGKILQIINTNDTAKLICNVDFICCGIGMDYKGNIIEYIDGAYDNCINHKLRLNIFHTRPNILINKFKQRLSKLVKRGWVPCNISKDRKVLYKKNYKIKNKKSNKININNKINITKEQFIKDNLYISTKERYIIINNRLLDYNFKTSSILYNTYKGLLNTTENTFTTLIYTRDRYTNIKHTFMQKLPNILSFKY